jgi:23S rRNA (cytidine1920-2'-O)/16S rRNA (cytidine1409-2'-O)-methyltransferase
MEKVDKFRLDQLLVQKGLFPSREAARRAIMAGLVTRNGEVLDKAGTFVRATDEIVVHAAEHSYVSRGGLKLERALQQFDVSVQGKIVIDVGASTGGFTDCALQHGASHVYAVDVGYGQLAWKLRNHPQVTVMERTNFRHVDAARFHPRPEVAVMDVSFISTKLLIPKLVEVLVHPAEIISLVKPQFEAGRHHVGKGGIVRDPQVHVQVLYDLVSFVESLGLRCGGLDYSPISGGDGNIEYLAWWRGDASSAHAEAAPLSPGRLSDDLSQTIREVVITAWQVLNQEDVSTRVRGKEIE